MMKEFRPYLVRCNWLIIDLMQSILQYQQWCTNNKCFLFFYLFYSMYCIHCPNTPGLPYQTMSSGRLQLWALPSIKFHGVGNTCACRTAFPVSKHLSMITLRAGDSIKAKSSGTIPSPFTSGPNLPTNGR